MDLVQCYEATHHAIGYARQQGPVLLEMKVERFMPHTTDDDDGRYRPKGEVEEARKRDPVVTMGEDLVQRGLITRPQVEEIAALAQTVVDEATDAADSASAPGAAGLHDSVYAP